MKRYNPLLFDLDGVLLDYQMSETFALTNTFKSFDLNFDMEKILKIYKKHNSRLWSEFEKGNVTTSELRILRAKYLLEEIELIQVKPDDFDKIYLSWLKKADFLLPNVREIIEYFYKKKILIAVTNGFKNVQYERLKSCHLLKYFDFIATSEEMGFQKPDYRFFRTLSIKFANQKTNSSNKKNHPLVINGKLDLNNSIIIGDSLSSDIQGGINYGLTTCLYTKDLREYYEIKPDYIIDDLLELKKIIG